MPNAMRKLLLTTTLLLPLFTFTAPHLPAQSAPGTWRLEAEADRQRTTVREETGRGYAALPASALVSVGAELWYEGDGVVARFDRTEVRFRVGSSEVTVGGETKTLSNPVYEEGGLVYLPADFFRRFLADASGGVLVVEPLERVVRRATARPTVAPDRPREAVAVAMDRTPAAPRRDSLAVVASRPAPRDTISFGGDEPVERPSAPPAAAPIRRTGTPSTPRASTPTTGSSTTASTAADAPPPVRPASTPPRRAQRRLVVVDAGHGGVDPGAIGPGGTREKHVTLRVARRVAELLRDDPTFEVRMTRDRDTLIALRDRARFANRWRGEGQPAVFISIHCNANESRYEKGYETYFLSEARTTDARRVEEFENSAMQYEEEAPAGGAMGFILTDLRQNHYLRESSDWAQMIQDRLRPIHPGPNRGVKQAGFAVLRGTFMPSVLVEIGFISNRQEEQLLTSDDAQERIARQLVDAIRAYFDRPSVSPTVDE